MRKRLLDHLALPRLNALGGLTAQPPFDFRISRQRAGAGARGVDQDSVEPRLAAERKGGGGIQNHARGFRRHFGQAAQVAIASDDTPSGGEQPGPFYCRALRTDRAPSFPARFRAGARWIALRGPAVGRCPD